MNFDAEDYCRKGNYPSLLSDKKVNHCGKNIEDRYLKELKEKIEYNDTDVYQDGIVPIIDRYPDYIIPFEQSLKSRLSKLDEVVRLQCSDGNYNYNEYMFGMANGLILAEGIIKNEDTIFINRPKKFIKNNEGKRTLTEALIWFGAALFTFNIIQLLLEFVK